MSARIENFISGVTCYIFWIERNEILFQLEIKFNWLRFHEWRKLNHHTISIILQPFQESQPHYYPSFRLGEEKTFNYLSKHLFQIERDTGSGHCHTNMRVTGFEPDVFRQLMEFAHTGRVDLMPRTIVGVICAADYYQFTGDVFLLF